MKTVLFLTNAYPYFPGEQFIEDEISHWVSQTAVKVVIVPRIALGIPRSMPAGIEVDLTVAQSRSFISKLTSVATASVSRLFWKEASFIYGSKGLKLSCYAEALRLTAIVLRIEKALKRVHLKHQSPDIAYCYWNEVSAYAAVLLKRARLFAKVVSRAHGFDLYEYRRSNQYMPLKRQFINEMDVILAIAQEGKNYLELTYDVPALQVIVSPLGVSIPSSISTVSNSHGLNIVSVSFCVPVKRIDKIIDAIALVTSEFTNLNIVWTHIGDGPLLSDLKRRAAEKLTSLKVKWNFLGNKQNFEVKQYFEKNSVDVFINASESEGVPVSIMEAMSYGVPVIAPNVGGIAELVSSEYGCLLSEAPSVADIASALVTMASRCKDGETRARAKQKIIDHYSADRNYRELVDLVVS